MRDTTKGGHEKPIPIHPDLEPVLREAITRSSSDLVFPAPRGGMLRDDFKFAEILRHTMASVATLRLHFNPPNSLPAGWGVPAVGTSEAHVCVMKAAPAPALPVAMIPPRATEPAQKMSSTVSTPSVGSAAGELPAATEKRGRDRPKPIWRQVADEKTQVTE